MEYPTKLDLLQDYRGIKKYIRTRVKEYPVYLNQGPGEDEDDVSLITLGFGLEQGGWYSLVFDTRPGAYPDGEWQSYIEENWVEVPHWNCIEEIWRPWQVELTHYAKNPKIPKTQFSFKFWLKLFNSMMRDALIESRDEGVFESLPLSPTCAMNVEEHEMRVGWPNFKKLRSEGTAHRT